MGITLDITEKGRESFMLRGQCVQRDHRKGRHGAFRGLQVGNLFWKKSVVSVVEFEEVKMKS